MGILASSSLMVLMSYLMVATSRVLRWGGRCLGRLRSPTEIDYLVYSGTRTPTDQGGVNNSFSFKNFRLGVYIYYSFGGVKRLPEQFATKYNDHQVMGKEFNRRWLRAGDEERTNVPVIATDAHRQANPYLSNAYTNYNKSDVRVAKTTTSSCVTSL